MRNDPRTSHLDEHSLKTIYAYVLGKVKKREDEERRHTENHERRAMDDLRSVLKRLDPPISVSDTWEEVRPRIEKSEEYRAINTESICQSVFDKFIRRLEERKKDRERDRERDRDRDRSRRDPRDRDRDRRDRDREYRNGHPDPHRRHRTRTRSPELDSYAAERRQAQQDREARYRNADNTGLSPTYRRNRDDDHYEPARRGSGDHYVRERREREAERERSYVSRADPREPTVSELDYGDSRPVAIRRRRESNESAGRRDAKRARFSPRRDRRSKTPAQQPSTEPKEDPNLRSGSEEGEIEED
jgi:pre-mRNA-processing factor 40